MPILSAIGAGFGSDDWKAQLQPGAKPLIKPLSNLGVDTLGSLRSGIKDFTNKWNLGTARQEGLMGEQEGVLRNLLNRRLASDPTQLLHNVGNEVMGLINPSVVNPLSQYDVNADMILRRARGLNPAAIDSTAERLRNARIASGRYYDAARVLSPLIPSLYNQVYNAGINDSDLAASYIPNIMSGYRTIDRAGLVPLNTAVDLTNAGAGNVSAINNAIKSGIFGYQKDRNIWDRLGAVDTSMWNSLKDAVNMAMSVYGGLGGMGALGGGLGGMAGGGGGGAPASSAPPPQPSFLPTPSPVPATGSFGTTGGGWSPYSWPPQSQAMPSQTALPPSLIYGPQWQPDYPPNFAAPTLG